MNLKKEISDMKLIRTKTQPLYTIDEQGHLDFPYRKKEAREKEPQDSVLEKPLVALVIILGCGFVDAVMMYQLFSSFLYDRPIIKWLSTIGFMIAYDIVPAIIGLAQKKKEQSFKINTTVVKALMSVFILVFIGTVYLRLVTRTMIIPSESQMTASLFTSGIESDVENPIALPFAIVSSLIPLATSIVSYAIGYFSMNPLKVRVSRLRVKQVEIEDRINKLETMLTEYNLKKDIADRLTKEDHQKYEKTKELVIDISNEYKHYVRVKLAERLGDPTSTNILTDKYDIQDEGLYVPKDISYPIDEDNNNLSIA